MSEIILRRADARDAEQLADLGQQTFRETFLDGFAIPYPPQDLADFVGATYAPAAFARKLADPRQATWLAEREGVPWPTPMPDPAPCPIRRCAPDTSN